MNGPPTHGAYCTPVATVSVPDVQGQQATTTPSATSHADAAGGDELAAVGVDRDELVAVADHAPGRRATPLIATRPWRRASRTASIERSAHSSHVVGDPGSTPSLGAVEVAAADRPLSERRPVGERAGVAAVPRPVPHLDEVGRLRQRHPPRAVPRPRVVDRHHAAALGGLGLPHVGRFAEVDPADLAEAVGVTDVGRHLLAGDEEDPGVVAGGGEVRMVADRVVVGDGEQVEARVRRPARPARRSPANRRSGRCGCGSRRPATRGRGRRAGRAAAGVPVAAAAAAVGAAGRRCGRRRRRS